MGYTTDSVNIIKGVGGRMATGITHHLRDFLFKKMNQTYPCLANK